MTDAAEFEYDDDEDDESTPADKLLDHLTSDVNTWCDWCKTDEHIVIEGRTDITVTIDCTKCGQEQAKRLVARSPRGTVPPGVHLVSRKTLDVEGTAALKLVRSATYAIVEMDRKEPKVFVHGNHLVTVDGDGHLVEMDLVTLKVHLADVACWRNARGKTIDPPAAVVSALLKARHWDFLPVLDSLVAVPTMRSDGSFLTAPGYHATWRTFYQPALGDIMVPEIVTQADVDNAVQLLTVDLLGDFCFVGESDLAHAVALLLLGFVRDRIDGPTPLHWADAPEARTGKGKLIDSLLAPAFGVVPSGPLDSQESERRKKIATELAKGSPVVKFDNVVGRVQSAVLELALTETRYNDRHLGRTDASASIDVPIRCVWCLTANHATASIDIQGRTLMIHLDARVERPGDRLGPHPGKTWRHPLPAWAHEHRTELATAALVLCRWWVQQGSPAPDLPNQMGGFEAWQYTLGGILECAGIPGFLGDVETVASADEVRDTLAQVFAALRDAYGDNAVEAKKIVDDGHLDKLWPDLNAQSAGMRLSVNKDRIVDGFALRQVVVPRKANQWRIEVMSTN